MATSQAARAGHPRRRGHVRLVCGDGGGVGCQEDGEPQLPSPAVPPPLLVLLLLVSVSLASLFLLSDRAGELILDLSSWFLQLLEEDLVVLRNGVLQGRTPLPLNSGELANPRRPW